jgi:rubrerythrin
MKCSNCGNESYRKDHYCGNACKREYHEKVEKLHDDVEDWFNKKFKEPTEHYELLRQMVKDLGFETRIMGRVVLEIVKTSPNLDIFPQTKNPLQVIFWNTDRDWALALRHELFNRYLAEQPLKVRAIILGKKYGEHDNRYDKGNEVKGNLYKCSCGYVQEAHKPNSCPNCHHSKKYAKFEKIKMSHNKMLETDKIN